MRFNWERPVKTLGTLGAAAGLFLLTHSPLAADWALVGVATLAASQAADVFGLVGSRFDQLRQRADAQVRIGNAANISDDPERSDLADLDADTVPSSGDDDPAPLHEALDKQASEDLEKMVQANKRGDFAGVEALAESVGKSMALAEHAENIDKMVQASRRGDRGEVAALAERVRQSAAELGRLEASPEPAGPSHDNASREAASRETARQGAPPELEQAGASDHAQQVPRGGHASDTDGRAAAGAQAERDEDSSRTGSPGYVQQPEGRRQSREASVGGVEDAETEVQGTEAHVGGLSETAHGVAAGQSMEPGATSGDEGESQASATDPSAERVSREAGTEPGPASPEPVSEPPIESWVLTGRYPGSGVTAEQLRAMQGPALKFDPPEAVTDAASRKQAALAAMTRDRAGIAQRSETKTEQPDEAQDPEPITDSDPAPPVRDREMD